VDSEEGHGVQDVRPARRVEAVGGPEQVAQDADPPAAVALACEQDVAPHVRREPEEARYIDERRRLHFTSVAASAAAANLPPSTFTALIVVFDRPRYLDTYASPSA